MNTNEALIVSMQQMKQGYLVFFRWRCINCKKINSTKVAFEMAEYMTCGACGRINNPEEVHMTTRINSLHDRRSTIFP